MDAPTRLATIFRSCACCGHVNVRPRRACEECGTSLVVRCGMCGCDNDGLRRGCDTCGAALRLPPPPPVRATAQTIPIRPRQANG
jgi:hypothetical protein